MTSGARAALLAPVRIRRGLPTRAVPEEPDPARVALCLSGGGYRAMLFHAGALRALASRGILARVTDVAGVSGGALVAASIALAAARGDGDLADGAVAAVERLARSTIDRPAVLGGLLGRGGAADRLARSIARLLVGDAPLAALPAFPRVRVTATALETGAAWAFDREGGRSLDGPQRAPSTLPLARAIAASCAFPPVLGPIDVPGAGPLVDGGVLDNLALETAWPACGTILSSDGGGGLTPVTSRVRWGWGRVGARVVRILEAETTDLRRRQLRDALDRPAGHPVGRAGAAWSLSEAGPALLARLPTRLAALAPSTIAALERAGEAACLRALDAAAARQPPMKDISTRGRGGVEAVRSSL